MLKTMKRLAFLVVFVGSIFLAACTPRLDIQVSDAWARPGLKGENSAIYLRIKNNTRTEDRFLNAEGSFASQVELHESSMGSDQVMSMHKQDFIPVAGQSQVELKPGGLHVMLINLTQDLKPGETVVLKMHFENAGEILLDVPVKQP